MPVTLSGVIITFNEEKNIGRCIDSLLGVVDEIVVVDSFSTDKTKEISINKGARFIQNRFDGHIEQKNFALGQSKYDHVLSLDADEALSPKLREEILHIKNNWNYDGYVMPRLTNYCGKWIKYSGWYPDKKLRLFNKNKAYWGGVNPHDKIIVSKDAKVAQLKGDLLHFSIYSIEEHIEQLNKFTTIGAKMDFERGRYSNIAKIILSPVFKFIKSYFLQKGFLDGYHGFLICSISSFASFLKFVKIRQLQRKENIP